MMTKLPVGDVLVCVPTYNEAGNVASIVQRLRTAQPDVHVLIVDDGSPDGTGAIADELHAADDHVAVLHRQRKAGLGAAYLAAFAWGFEHGFSTLVEMDADGSHRPEELGRLLDEIRDGADLALGARWVPGGQIVNWPRRRVLLSRGGNRYARFMLGVPMHDITGGFRAYRSTALSQLELHNVNSSGYCFQVELAWRASRSGMKVVEVPITFVEREVGASKMSGSIVIEAMFLVGVWGVRRRIRDLARRLGWRRKTREI